MLREKRLLAPLLVVLVSHTFGVRGQDPICVLQTECNNKWMLVAEMLGVDCYLYKSDRNYHATPSAVKLTYIPYGDEHGPPRVIERGPEILDRIRRIQVEPEAHLLPNSWVIRIASEQEALLSDILDIRCTLLFVPPDPADAMGPKSRLSWLLVLDLSISCDTFLEIGEFLPSGKNLESIRSFSFNVGNLGVELGGKLGMRFGGNTNEMAAWQFACRIMRSNSKEDSNAILKNLSSVQLTRGQETTNKDVLYYHAVAPASYLQRLSSYEMSKAYRSDIVTKQPTVEVSITYYDVAHEYRYSAVAFYEDDFYAVVNKVPWYVSDPAVLASVNIFQHRPVKIDYWKRVFNHIPGQPNPEMLLKMGEGEKMDFWLTEIKKCVNKPMRFAVKRWDTGITISLTFLGDTDGAAAWTIKHLISGRSHFYGPYKLRWWDRGSLSVSASNTRGVGASNTRGVGASNAGGGADAGGSRYRGGITDTKAGGGGHRSGGNAGRSASTGGPKTRRASAPRVTNADASSSKKPGYSMVSVRKKDYEKLLKEL